MTVSTHLSDSTPVCPNDVHALSAQPDTALLQESGFRFIDNVSHEFRTPLAVIGEYASLLGEGLLGELNSEQSEFVAIIGDRANDLCHMVDDLMDSTRADAGMVGVQRRKTTWSEILERVLPVIQKKIQVRNIQLNLECPETLPSVYCDPEKAARVLFNLVVNGIKRTDAGGEITIRARRQDNSHFVEIGVTNTGKGFRQEDADRIAERFQSVSSKRAGRITGFGLGLNIANELVDRFCGQMCLLNVPGEGCTFSFTIPLAEREPVCHSYLKRVARLYGASCRVACISVSSMRSLPEGESGQLHALIESIVPAEAVVWRASLEHWDILGRSEDIQAAELDKRLRAALAASNEIHTTRPLTYPSFKVDEVLVDTAAAVAVKAFPLAETSEHFPSDA